MSPRSRRRSLPKVLDPGRLLDAAIAAVRLVAALLTWEAHR